MKIRKKFCYIEVFVIRNYCVVRIVDGVLSVESAHPQVGNIYISVLECSTGLESFPDSLVQQESSIRGPPRDAVQSFGLGSRRRLIAHSNPVNCVIDSPA